MNRKILTLGFAVLALATACVLHNRQTRDDSRTFRWPSMGTIAQVTVRGNLAHEDDLIARVRDSYTHLESRLSAWDPTSELSRLAADGCTNWLAAVSPDVRPCYAAALRLARESKNAFNPAVGRTLRTLGIGRRGTYASFDLGAIAKGFAVDFAAKQITTGPSESLLLDLGGNLRVLGDRPWRAGIRNPFSCRDASQPAFCAVVVLTNGESVATSGNYERFIEKDGKRLSHILDGRTGEPTHGIAGVTVITPSAYGATLADGLSTTLFVLGPDEGAPFLATYYPQALALWIPDTPSSPRLIATQAMARRLEQATAPIETR